MVAIALVVAFAVGFVVGYLTRRYRLSLLAENNHWCGEEIEALKGADLHADVARERALRLSGEHKPVQLYDQDAETHDIEPDGYCPVEGHHVEVGRRAHRDWWVGCSCGFEADHLGDQARANQVAAAHRENAERLAEMDGVAALVELAVPGAVVEVTQPKAMWCAKSVEAWCAVIPNEEPEEGAWSVETVCGYGITLPGGFDLREPTCPDCRATLAAYPLRAWASAVHDPHPELADPDTPDTAPRTVPGRLE